MSNISTLGQALDQISRLKKQQNTMDLLTMQLTTQKKTQAFSGLKNDVMLSQRARTDTTALTTYTNNITNAERRIKMMLQSVEAIKSHAENIANSLIIAMREGDYPELEQIQDLAENTLNFILDTMNHKDGNRYVFSGADSSTKPISDTGLFQAFMGEYVPDAADLTNPPLVASGAIGQWGDGTITTAQFIATYRDVNETIIGYSPSLTNGTAGKVFARVGDNSEFDYTVLANTPGMKEIVIALNVLKSMPPVDYAPGALNDPTVTTLPEDQPPFPPKEKQENFFAVINDLSTMLNDAIDKMDTQGFRLAQVSAQITTIKQSHNQDINTLANIIGDVEDIDTTDVAAKINQMQVQLEASYRVTALLSELTLARFI